MQSLPQKEDEDTVCCVFDPAEYRDGQGQVEKVPAASADEAEPEVDEVSAEEAAHRCC